MTYTRVDPRLAAQREQQLRWCDTDHTRQAFRSIWLLDDEEVLELARVDTSSRKESPVFARMIAYLGGDLWDGGRINPCWLIGAAVDDAYDRDLIGEDELDRLTAGVS